MADMMVLGIKSNYNDDWIRLPTATAIKPAVNSLDSEKSGRDNNTGMMFRDKIADKLKYVVDLPSKMTNNEVSRILKMLLKGSVWIYFPDIVTGTFQSKQFYCTSAEPEIEKINAINSWTYKAWSFTITEM